MEISQIKCNVKITIKYIQSLNRMEQVPNQKQGAIIPQETPSMRPHLFIYFYFFSLKTIKYSIRITINVLTSLYRGIITFQYRNIYIYIHNLSKRNYNLRLRSIVQHYHSYKLFSLIILFLYAVYSSFLKKLKICIIFQSHITKVT